MLTPPPLFNPSQRFTEKAIKVVMLAQEEARRLGHNFVGTEQVRPPLEYAIQFLRVLLTRRSRRRAVLSSTFGCSEGHPDLCLRRIG